MMNSQPAWSIKGRYQYPKKERTPSPCAYTSEYFGRRTSPSWKVGSGKKCPININSNPGPGTYQTTTNLKSKRLGKFGRQNIYSKCLVDDKPGPGQYQPLIRSVRKSSQVVSFGRQCKVVDKSHQIPGPGAYNPPTKSVPRGGVAIGKGERFSHRQYESSSPGPGNYHCSRPSSAKQSSFSRDTRICTEISHFGQPGPGSYSKASLFEDGVLQKKGFSLGVRPDRKVQEILPGPGEYDPRSTPKDSTPSITIASKYKPVSPERNPGPGQYSPHLMESNVYLVMKTAKRDHLGKISDVPGPGTYDFHVKKETPMFSLGHSRKTDFQEDIPGPGAYSPNKNFVKSRPQSAKMGQEKRSMEIKENAPGPGQYDNHKSRPSSPKYTFTRDSRLKVNTTVSPGPGEYPIPSVLANTPSYALR